MTNGPLERLSFWLPWVVVSVLETYFDTHHKSTTTTASNGSFLTSWPCCSLAYPFLSSRLRVRNLSYQITKPPQALPKSNHYP